MSDFNKSIKVVLSHEGGLVDNPSDRGGITNFGITMEAATAYLGGEPATRAYIAGLTPEVAAAIYRKNFWTPLGLDAISNEDLATVVFDLAVLRGFPTMVRLLQRLCGVPEDGLMGPRTVTAFQDAAHADPKGFGNRIILECQAFFNAFADAHPNQRQFLSGWINRTNQLKELMA